MKVYLKRASDGAVLGQGSTNNSGSATISWSTFPWESAPTAYIELRFEETNNRFFIKNATGGNPTYATTNTGQLIDNGSASFGTQNIGWSNTPNPLMNLYAAAWWTWNTLADSNRMVSDFTNHEIRAFDTSGGPSNNSGFSNRTVVSSAAQYLPQTIAHEMGHQAVSTSNSYTPFTDYCYSAPGAPAEPPPCSHSPGQPEWQGAGFNEAYAELISMRTFYRQTSTAFSCRTSLVRCSAAAIFSAEPSVGTANCNATSARNWREMARYLWDVYDAGNDAYGDSLQRPFSAFIDVLVAHPNGNDNRQDNEPYNFFGLTDDPDGRNAADIRFVWATTYSSPFQSLAQLNNNCGNTINP
jgi:hypothetical protein